jgi:hypothetical protein
MNSHWLQAYEAFVLWQMFDRVQKTNKVSLINTDFKESNSERREEI